MSLMAIREILFCLDRISFLTSVLAYRNSQYFVFNQQVSCKTNQVMKENMCLGMNRPPSNSKGVPKYSDKYKDVLERANKREEVIKPKPRQLFFYRVRSIGVGAFSFVYLVAEQNSGTIFAQKSINKKSIAPELFTQIKMHLSLSHSNIVNLYHIYSEQGYIQLIMDYAGQSLFVLRKNNKLSTINNEDLTISILRQLISAVQYLHSHKIVHADIKLQNILYLQGVVKLCDFGYAHISLSKQTEDRRGNQYNYQLQQSNHIKSQGNDVVGTLQYLDPEYVQGRHSEYSRDIWAIGIVAYELLVGRNPFEGMAENEKWSSILKMNKIQTKSLKISTQMHSLLEMTLCPIEKRACIDELAGLKIFTKHQCNPNRFQMTGTQSNMLQLLG